MIDCLVDEQIRAMLTRLRMPHLKRQIDELVQEATTQRWKPGDVIEHALRIEDEGRRECGRKRRLAALAVPDSKSFTTFDRALCSIDGPRLDFIESLEWVDRGENLVIAGPQGTGKSHLVGAAARSVVERGGKAQMVSMTCLGDLITSHRIDATIDKQIAKIAKNDLVVIDDLGILPIGTDCVEGFYRLVEACYETTSLALTTNLHPGSFDKIMPGNIAASLVDRLLHHAHMITTTGESIRRLQAKTGKGVKAMT